MKYIKDKNKITANYLGELRVWIKEHQKEFFAIENEADSWFDFIAWPDKTTDRNHLIMLGEICIIDRLYEGKHAYMICQFYGERKARDLFFVCWVDDLDRAYWRNGYFLIPDLPSPQQKKEER